MPIYFVNVQDGDLFESNDVGSNLKDFAAARDEAIRILPEIAKDELPDGESRQFVATVRDADGWKLYRATLTFQGKRL